MKFKKEWKYIVIILLIVLLILFIYNFNENNNKKEHFQDTNNNSIDDNKYIDLKKQIAAFININENRISNLKVSGVEPTITVSYHILPRNINDISASTLLDIENDLNDRKKNMGFDFTIDGKTLKFVNMNVNSLNKSTEKQYNKLMNKFIDRDLDGQIQYLKDIQKMVKYNNPTDRFYKFTTTGDLIVDTQKYNNIPLEGQEGSLKNNIPPIEQLNNTINSNNNTNNETVEEFTLNNYKFY